MPRKSREIRLAYVEMSFTNGAKYRISGDLRSVWEIEPQPFDVTNGALDIVRGPISLEKFLSLLEQEKERRNDT